MYFVRLTATTPRLSSRWILGVVGGEVAAGWLMIAAGATVSGAILVVAVVAVLLSLSLLWFADVPAVVRAVLAALLVTLLLVLTATSGYARGPDGGMVVARNDLAHAGTPVADAIPATRGSTGTPPVAGTALSERITLAADQGGGAPVGAYAIEAEVTADKSAGNGAARLIWYVRDGDLRARCGSLAVSAPDDDRAMVPINAAFDRAILQSRAMMRPVCE